MANLFLGFPNRIASAALSGGSWLAALPLANLKDERLSIVARSTDTLVASTMVDLDLGGSYSVRTVSIVNHNLSQDATVRVTGGTSAGASDVYDSGWQDAYALTFGPGGVEWESAGWWPGAGADEYVRSPWTFHCPMADWRTARYWLVEIDDTTNPDGYVQIGRVWIGGGLVPRYNASYGLRDAWIDPSEVEETIDGSLAALIRRRRRTVRFELEWLDAVDGHLVYELMRRQGTTGEVLYLPDVADWQAAQRFGFLGRLRELTALEYPRVALRAAAFELVEIV